MRNLIIYTYDEREEQATVNHELTEKNARHGGKRLSKSPDDTREKAKKESRKK